MRVRSPAGCGGVGGRGGRLRLGLQGDFVAERFELADVGALLAIWVDPGVVVAGSEIKEAGVGLIRE